MGCWRRPAAAAVLGLTVGCTFSRMLWVRFADETGCGEDPAVHELADDEYRVSGCGQTVTYVCRGEGSTAYTRCVRRATTVPPAPPPPETVEVTVAFDESRQTTVVTGVIVGPHFTLRLVGAPTVDPDRALVVFAAREGILVRRCPTLQLTAGDVALDLQLSVEDRATDATAARFDFPAAQMISLRDSHSRPVTVRYCDSTWPFGDQATVGLWDFAEQFERLRSAVPAPSPAPTVESSAGTDTPAPVPLPPQNP